MCTIPHPHIVLIGHRGSGKSVIGRRLAALRGLPFVDVDDAVAAAHGRSAAELVAGDEPAFRAFENSELVRCVSSDRASVIATGGGLQSVPSGCFVIWIDRERWEDTAATQRTRLRSDLPLEEELAWMREQREPRYARASHYRLHIEQGCTEADAAARLDAIITLMLRAVSDGGLSTTWIVPELPADVDRCFADAALFGLAGVEIRSDRIDRAPSGHGPWLASLRTPDDEFFHRSQDAAGFDCDIALLDHAGLDGLEPRPLIISTHPHDVSKEFFDAMLRAGNAFAERWPAWAPHVTYKFAPVVKSWIELRFGYELCRVFLRTGGRVSFFPQGKRWNWMRVFRFRTLNEFNFMSPGADAPGGAPPALSYFLPSAAGPVPRVWCGVIGDPVEHSIGDVWHRCASLQEEDGGAGYLKIHVPSDELETALYFLLKLNIHGLSVTAPHKRTVIESNFVTSRDGDRVGNTLTLRDGGWSLTDTDCDGMRAALAELASHGIVPGPVAVFGTGGVTPAVVSVLDEQGWKPVIHVSARDGWAQADDREVTLVVNAGGPDGMAHAGAPRSRAWLDLHYRDIRVIPDVDVYANGMTFYEAQARAQRREWGFGHARP